MRRENVGVGSLDAAARTAAFLFFLLVCTVGHCQDADTSRMLTPYQRQSIIDYCEQYGDILSAGELANIDGFTPDEAMWFWESLKEASAPPGSGGRHLLSTKFRKKYFSDGFSTTGKYRYEGRRLSAGLTVDNDPMEKFPDFLSGYLKYGNFIAGDFSARFGQGLVLWKAFSLNTMGEPSTVMRRQAGFDGYKSSDESNYLRGICAKIPIGQQFECSAFASYNKVDLKSVDSAGVHEFVAGLNLSCSSENWRVGLTAVTYCYDRQVQRRVGDYNRLRLYEGLWGNAGIDFTRTLNHWRLFGEAAMDARASAAAIAGAIWSPSYNLEASVTAKAFSPSYSATHSIGDTYNLMGGQASVKYLRGRWKFNLNAEYGWHPWYQYGKPAGETTFKARFSAQYSFSKGATATIQTSYNTALKMRLHLSVPFGPITVSSRFEGNLKGYVIYAEAAWHTDKFDVSARGTFYNTDGWNSRVYVYEKNTPESFAVETFYGKGMGAYLVIRYTPIKYLDIWLKARHDYSAFFIRMVIPG